MLWNNSNRKYLDTVANGKFLPSLKELFLILTTFFLITFSWIFFRADSVPAALNYILRICNRSIFDIPMFFDRLKGLITLVFIIILLIFEWRGRTAEFPLDLKVI